MSIKSFRHKGLKRLFEDDDRRGVLAGQADKIRDVLAAVDAAEEPGDVSLFPGWRLHPEAGPQRVLERHHHRKLARRLPFRRGRRFRCRSH